MLIKHAQFLVLTALQHLVEPQPLTRTSSAANYDLACPHPPTVLKSCSSNHLSLARSSTLVLQNLLDKPLLLEWLDSHGDAVPRYVIPADCSVWVPALLGDALRARAALIPGGRSILPCKQPLSKPLRPGVMVPQLAEVVNTSARTGPSWTALGGGLYPDIVFELNVLTTGQKTHLQGFAFGRGHDALCSEVLAIGHTVGGMDTPFDPSDEVEIALLPDGHPACAPSAGHWLPPNRPLAMRWPPNRAGRKPHVYGPPVPVALPPEPEAQQSLFGGPPRPPPGPEVPPFELELTHHDVRLLGGGGGGGGGRKGRGGRRKEAAEGREDAGSADAIDTEEEDTEEEEDAETAEAFQAFLRSLDEGEGYGYGGAGGKARQGRVTRITRATLSLVHGKVVGSAPTEPHEGVTVTALTTPSDLAQPRPIGAAFARPTPCPFCNYKLTEAEAEAGNSSEGGNASAKKAEQAHSHKHHRIDPSHLIPLETCPRCGGEGIVSISSDLPPLDIGAGGYSHATQRTRTHCPVCGGVGTVHAAGHSCASCGGRRFLREPASFGALLPAGVPDTWTDTKEREGGMVPFKTEGAIRTLLLIEQQPADPRKRQAIEAELSAVSAFSVRSPSQRLSNYTRLPVPLTLMRAWAGVTASKGNAGSGGAAGAAVGSGRPPPTANTTVAYLSALSCLSSMPLFPAAPSTVVLDGPHLGATLSLSLEAAVAGFRLRVRPPCTRMAKKPESSLEGEEEAAWRESMEAEARAAAAAVHMTPGPWGLGHGPGDVLEVDTDGEGEENGDEQEDTAEGAQSGEDKGKGGLKGIDREPDEVIDLDAPSSATGSPAAGGALPLQAGKAQGSGSSSSSSSRSSKAADAKSATPSPSPSSVDEDFGARPWMLDMRGQPVLPGDMLVLPGAGLPLYLPSATVPGQIQGVAEAAGSPGGAPASGSIDGLLSGHCVWSVACPTGDREACGLPAEVFAANCSGLAAAWRASFSAYLTACESLPPLRRTVPSDPSILPPYITWKRLASVPIREVNARLGWIAGDVVAAVAEQARILEQAASEAAAQHAANSTAGASTAPNASAPAPAPSPMPVPSVQELLPGRPALGSLHVLCPAMPWPGMPLPWPAPHSAVRLFPHGSALYLPLVDAGLGLPLGLHARGEEEGQWGEEGKGQKEHAEAGSEQSADQTEGKDGTGGAQGSQSTDSPPGAPASPSQPGSGSGFVTLLPGPGPLASLRALVRSAVALMGPGLLPQQGNNGRQR